jgi:hypothetical protein
VLAGVAAEGFGGLRRVLYVALVHAAEVDAAAKGGPGETHVARRGAEVCEQEPNPA